MNAMANEYGMVAAAAAAPTVVLNDVELLKEGVELARLGRKEEARILVAQACLLNPMNELAWLWRASLAPTTAHAAPWLERVLQLNPGHETARNWLARLRPPAAPPFPKPELQTGPVWACPFCSFESSHELERCTDCGGINKLSLEKLDANKEVNERQLHYAMEHYAQKLASGDVQSAFYVGLAALNLRLSHQAYRAFQRHLENHPNDEEVRRVAETLGARPLALAVEDNPKVRAAICDGLEKAQYRTVALPGGEEAIHFLTTDAKPAFILLDVAMPGMDGYQLCKIIKAMPKAKDVPVVMLSGDGLVDRVRGRFAGASDFLGKPVNPEAMLKVVRKLADDKA